MNSASELAEKITALETEVLHLRDSLRKANSEIEKRTRQYHSKALQLEAYKARCGRLILRIEKKKFELENKVAVLELEAKSHKTIAEIFAEASEQLKKAKISKPVFN